MYSGIRKKNADALSVVLAAVNGKTGQVFVEVNVKETEVKEQLALLDTGAGVSIIESQLVEKINSGHILEDKRIIRNASGMIMTTTGKIKLTLEIGNKQYEHEFVIMKERRLPSKIIIGWDFLRRYEIKFQSKPLSLYIEKDKIKVVELPIEHMLNITKEKEIIQSEKEEVNDNITYKCQVSEAKLLSAGKMGYITLETKLTDSDVGIYEPVVGNSGTHMLCPGLVTFEKDKDKRKSRFTIKYINHTSEDIEVESGRTLGYVQPCYKEEIEKVQDEVVSTIVERSEEERLNDLFAVVDIMLPEKSKENEILKSLIRKYPSVFSSDDDPPSVTPFYYHTIHLDSTPKPKKPYVIPACFHEKVQKQIQEMIQYGIIRPSRSPFHSPLVPVVKKDGKIRLCVDFRNLNNNIVSDSYPLPNINNILHNLGKGTIFTCLDLKQGYHQIPLTEESKALTAFIAPGGLFEYNVMPMGLKDSPSAFSRIISQVLVGLTGNNTHVYMDDIIIQGKNLQDHVSNLEKVLSRLQEARLTLKLSKCEFFKNSVKYLGHIVSAEGLKAQPEKIEVIQNMIRPKTVKQLQSFLGMANYYRKFIRDFSDIAAPLTKLTGGKANDKKNKRQIAWNEEAEAAFIKLKEALAEKVTLSFPDLSKSFFLTTDASNIAIGGVLQQKDENNHLRPLTFFSRKLNQSEMNYSTIEKEALAIIYGLKINRSLCLGFPIIIHTDHRPLTWLLTTSSANSRIARWQMMVAEYDIQIKFIPGKENTVADCLSRLRQQEDSLIEENVLVITPEKESESIEWNLDELVRLQNEDIFYGTMKRLLEESDDVEFIRKKLGRQKIEKKYRRLNLEELKLENDVLYRVAQNSYGELTRQVIVPDSYKYQVLRLAHSLPTAGHGGVQITLARCKKFSYWPEMKKDVQEYCKSCLVCRRFKRLGDAPAPLRRYPDVEMPFERVHLDIIGPMGNSERGFKYVLVAIDVLTRYLIAEPLRTKEAKEVAKVFFEAVVCKQGVPRTLVTDQGKEFVNKILEGIANLLKMRHVTTTPYHPQANGVIERCNGTVINILRTLIEDNVSIWDTMLPIAVFAYNSGYNRTIKDSPFYLMHLRDPSFPFEIMKDNKKWYNVEDFREEMATKATRVYARCQKYLEEAQGQLERQHSKRATIKPVKVGDRVYVRQAPAKGSPSKLQPAYAGPFRVINKISDVVVKVRNIRTGTSKTLHTDRIRIIHEDNMAPHQNNNVRKAYPVHGKGETRETKITLQPVDPFPFYTDNNSHSEDEEENEDTVDQQSDLSEPESIPLTGASLPQQRYNLRSTSTPPELPLVMDKPLEYIKEKETSK